MWYCYITRKEDGFKHLALISENVSEINDFILEIKNLCPNKFTFEIKREEIKNEKS